MTEKTEKRFSSFAGLDLTEEEVAERIIQGFELSRLFDSANSASGEAASRIISNIVRKLNLDKTLSIYEFELVERILLSTAKDKKLALSFINPKDAKKPTKRDLEFEKRVFRYVENLRDIKGMSLSENSAFAEAANYFFKGTRTISRGYYNYRKHRDIKIDEMIDHAISNLGLKLTTEEGSAAFASLSDCEQARIKQKFIDEEIPKYRETLERMF